MEGKGREGKRPILYFEFVGEPILIQDLVGPKFFRELQTILQRFQK